MSIASYFGVVLVLASSGLLLWWANQARPNLKYVARLTFFLITAGVLLVFNTPVTEISFGKIASIKTSASRAATSAKNAAGDAAAIADLRAKIQTQAETVKKVSDQASEANRKTDVIDKLVTKATDGFKTIQSTVDLTSLLARAGSDDRKAFDDLIRISQETDNPAQTIARSALARIVDDLSSKLTSQVDWKALGFSEATVTFDDLVEAFQSHPAFDQPAILRAIWSQRRFSKYSRLSFLDHVIAVTPSVSVLAAACAAMDEEAKIKRNVIGYSLFQEWWLQHAVEYVR